MSYQIKILMLAFAIAFVISLIVIPILRRRKIGQQERDDGPKSHLKKQGTPTMGGIVMILAIIIIGAIVFLKYSKSSRRPLGSDTLQLSVSSRISCFSGVPDSSTIRVTISLKPS